ncbi:MAG: hypothetical protein LYZ69_08290 [Nitrososphaerales archaeon]|nr:hypothetical protein [Nitrososphaerales archaeon]
MDGDRPWSWTTMEIGEHFERKAKTVLADLGFADIRDGPKMAPYDLTAMKDGKLHYIEVKGSLSEKIAVMYYVQMGKLKALAHMDNVLFLFIAGRNAERWKLVEFDKMQDVSARVRLYSGKLRVRIRTATKNLTLPSGNPVGRPRTLQGTKLVPLRIDRRLIDLLDKQAEEEGVSRQTLMGRILASAVLEQLRTSAKAE